jgi:phytol kinase
MTAEATLLTEIHAALWVVVPMGIVFGLCEWLHHFRGVEVETTRKISHVSGGLAVLCLPFVAATHWTVLGIAVTFLVILGLTKKLKLLPSIHSVARKTRGAEYYPIAVYLIFVLADGDTLLYCIPILVMAFSDTGAAVVGQRYGLVSYRVIDGFRSLGGSVTFFGLTFALVLMGLGLAGHGDLPAVLLITLLTAIVVTAVEGISVRGADNLLVPYATWLVLRHTIALDRDGLGLWIMGTALVLTLLLATFRQSKLNATGFMAAFVAGTLAWGLGGPLWFAVLAVPYLLYSSTRPLIDLAHQATADLKVLVSTFSVSLVLVLAHGHIGDPLLFVPFAASVAAVNGIVLGGIVRHMGGGSIALLGAGVLGAAAAIIPVLVFDAPMADTTVIAALALMGAVAAPFAAQSFRRIDLSPSLARVGGVLVGTAAAATWVVGQVLG